MGGVTLLQLREKEKSTREYIDLAEKVHTITKKYNVPLIIDDRTDVALAVDAEGVHVGQSDMPVSTARKLMGERKIIGQIPYWDEIKNKICQIGKYLFELEYLGFDVAVTENGFKIIEINSFQGIDFFQIKYPLKGKNEKTKKYFDRKIGNKNGYSKIR